MWGVEGVGGGCWAAGVDGRPRKSHGRSWQHAVPGPASATPALQAPAQCKKSLLGCRHAFLGEDGVVSCRATDSLGGSCGGGNRGEPRTGAVMSGRVVAGLECLCCCRRLTSSASSLLHDQTRQCRVPTVHPGTGAGAGAGIRLPGNSDDRLQCFHH